MLLFIKVSIFVTGKWCINYPNVKNKITGNSKQPIALLLFTPKIGASIPIAVAVSKINNPINEVK